MTVNQHDESAANRNAGICPECGFDMGSDTRCRVCGYDRRKDLSQSIENAHASKAPLAYLIAVVTVLIVFFLATTMHKAASGVTMPADPVVAAPQAEAAGRDLPVAPPAAATMQPETATPPAEPAVARTSLPPFDSRGRFVAWMIANTDQKEKYLKARWDRAEIIARLEQTANKRVLEAFLLTPREYFCRDPRRAYESAALPIGYGQTISGPHMVARMTDYLNPQPEQKVLEIGTGSGYQAALLSELSNHVFTIEIVAALAEETDKIFKKLQGRFPEYGNIMRKVDDGYYGWSEYAPFDRIIVTCGIDHIPPELLAELSPDGIMVIPVGPPSGQTILRIEKHVAPDGTVTLDREDIFHGRRKEVFVPFTASEGGVHTEIQGSSGR